MSLFLCLSGISLEWYWGKSLAKSGGFRKKIKGAGGGAFKPSAHCQYIKTELIFDADFCILVAYRNSKLIQSFQLV